MTSAPDSRPGQADAAPGQDVRQAAGGGVDDRVAVVSAGSLRPAEPVWLVVTEIDGAGEVLSASQVPGPHPHACGGDVLLRLAPGTGTGVRVAVWAVAAGVLVPVAVWDLPAEAGWPERIRATISFAKSALTQLGEYAGLGERDPVDLDTAPAGGLLWLLSPDRRAADTG